MHFKAPARKSPSSLCLYWLASYRLQTQAAQWQAHSLFALAIMSLMTLPASALHSRCAVGCSANRSCSGASTPAPLFRVQRRSLGATKTSSLQTASNRCRLQSRAAVSDIFSVSQVCSHAQHLFAVPLAARPRFGQRMMLILIMNQCSSTAQHVVLNVHAASYCRLWHKAQART